MLSSAVFKDAYNSVDGCFAWEPVQDTNVSFGGITDITAQAFDDSSDLQDTQAYWTAIMTNTCGEDWFESVLSAPDPATTAPELDEIWKGSLPWTLYGPGGCQDKDETTISATGGTSALYKLEDGAVCETDWVDTNVTDDRVLMYSKLVPVSCGEVTTEFILYNCDDPECVSCDDTAEAGESTLD